MFNITNHHGNVNQNYERHQAYVGSLITQTEDNKTDNNKEKGIFLFCRNVQPPRLWTQIQSKAASLRKDACIPTSAVVKMQKVPVSVRV